MKSTVLTFGLSLLVCGLVSAQDTERVLVPIYEPFPIPGAFGSEWVSDFRIYNASDDAVVIDNFGSGCYLEPCVPARLRPKTTISGAFVRNIFIGDWNQGAVLKVQKSGVDNLVFQLRVRDVSRGAEGWGTWVPVVRESRLAAGPVHLLNIPVEEGYRITLRLYTFQEAGHVDVHIFGTDDALMAQGHTPDEFLGAVSLQVSTGGGSEPGYAQFAGLGELVQGRGFRLVRLEIIPENGLRLWAMVSVTNNVTQQVTGVYPNE